MQYPALHVQAPNMLGGLAAANQSMQQGRENQLRNKLLQMQIAAMPGQQQREQAMHDLQMEQVRAQMLANTTEAERAETKRRAEMVGAGIRVLQNTPQEQRARVYGNLRSRFLQEGFDAEALPETYSPEIEASLPALALESENYIKFMDDLDARAFTRSERISSQKYDMAKQGDAQAFTAGQNELDRRAEQKRHEDDMAFKLEEVAKRTRAEMADADKELFQRANTLRDDFTSSSKEFATVNEAYERIATVGNNPSAVGDIALITGYMKLLDPGSTVREGEFATAADAGSVPNALVARYNKLINGERLSGDTRADFLKQSRRLYEIALEAQEKRVALFNERADRAGVDRRDVTTPIPALPDEPGTADDDNGTRLDRVRKLDALNGRR